MNLKEWYILRGSKFIYQRGEQLVKRYNFTPGKAMHRIERCMATLAEYGCFPTLPTPGVIVKRYPGFIKRLQDQGVEIAVHGDRHVNLNDYPLLDAIDQLERAVRTFESLGIEAHGFRCPYIGCSAELLDLLPEGLFNYSSNQVIRWELSPGIAPRYGYKFYDTLNNLYHASAASDTICIPSKHSNLVEIPVCIPDDLQLYDGLNLGVGIITQTWKHILDQTHNRGELFTLIFHTELAELCLQPLAELISQAKCYNQLVWVAPLRGIAEWWREKSRYQVAIATTSGGLRISFECSPRATILARGCGSRNGESLWGSSYVRLTSDAIQVPAEPRPFIGLPPGTPEGVLSFLQDQGYILDTGDTASKCGIFLDSRLLSRLTSQVQLIDYIEASNAPLVRYWRWPDGARSALSITGDLDALSLLDYASRLVNR